MLARRSGLLRQGRIHIRLDVARRDGVDSDAAAVHSLAKLLVSCATAPLDAAYAGTVSPPWKDSSDAKLTMLPRRPVADAGGRSSMCAPASRHSVNTALRLTWRTCPPRPSQRTPRGRQQREMQITNT